MLKFKDFLKEEFLVEDTAGKDTKADDKGKLYEIIKAGYMHPDTKGGWHQDPEHPDFHLPSHHRSESENPDHAGTPKQVHDKLRKKVGEAAYQEINKHAYEMHLKQKDVVEQEYPSSEGYVHGNSYWTSNPDKINKKGEEIPGDHFKTTKKFDANAKGDSMTEIHKVDKDGKKILDEDGKPKVFGHLAWSDKYGYTKDANFANMGLDTIEKLAKIKSGSLDAHQQEHLDNMDSLGHTGSADTRNIQTKIDEMGVNDTVDAKGKKVLGAKSLHKELSAKNKIKPLEGKEKTTHEHLGMYLDYINNAEHGTPKQNEMLATQRAQQARESADNATKKIAKDIHSGLSSQTEQEHRENIINIISPKTLTKHFISHSHVQEDGTANHSITAMDTLARDHLARFDEGSIEVAKHTGSNNIVYKGRLNEPGHPKHGQMVNVATLNVKTGSGAHKGRVVTAKLNNLKH
jgi:hypothetical protein